MSGEYFNKIEVTFEGVHPRAHPRCTRTPHDRLTIVGNNYVPKSNRHPATGDVTLIVAHANGFHKELYEPYLEALARKLSTSLNVQIRGIWAMDIVNQGASGIRNEEKLGDYFHWLDPSRDMLKMVQLYDIPQPIIGVGHSMGGCQIMNLALLQPSLFTAIIAIDPVIQQEKRMDHSMTNATLSSRRRDIWTSMEEAKKYFNARAFYRSWDPRVLDLHLQYGLRPLPTFVYPDVKQGYTLATTRYQEVYTFVEAAVEEYDGNQKRVVLSRPEPSQVHKRLAEVQPPVFYIFGSESDMSSPPLMNSKINATPGCEHVVVQGAGHLIPQEKVQETADLSAPFIAKHIHRWRDARMHDFDTVRNKTFSDVYVKGLARKAKM